MRVPFTGITVTPLPSHGLGDFTDQETPDRYLCTIPSRPECLTALGASACGNKELNNKRAGLAWLPCLRNNSPGRSVSDRLAGAAGT